jgi:hypothetical protein
VSICLSDSLFYQDYQVFQDYQVLRDGLNGRSRPTVKKTAKKEKPPTLNQIVEQGSRELGRYLAGSGREWQFAFLLFRRLKLFGDALTSKHYKIATTAFLEGMDEVLETGELDAEGLEQELMVLAKDPTKVRLAEGQDPIEAAVVTARAQPLDFEGSTGERYDKVASIAYHLWNLMVGIPFLLPQERLAELIGTTQKNVSRTIKLLVQDGVVQELEGGWSYLKKKAKEYRFTAKSGTFNWKQRGKA